MQQLNTNSLFTAGLLSSVILGLVNPQPIQASSLQLNFLGQSIVQTGTTFGGTQVGGLSGIDYSPALDVYYANSDDRSTINPARFYTLTLDLSQFNNDGNNSGVTFTDVTTLLQANGQPFPANSLDPEDLTLVNGNVYIPSEGEVSTNRIVDPFFNSFDVTTGQQNQALPIPSQFIPQPNSIPTTSGVRNNLSLESATVTPDFRYLFTASENALVQDGPVATVSNGTPSRILQYDLTTGQPIAQFIYNTDPVALPPNPSGQFNTNGLVDLLALDNSGQRFLALERSFSVGAVGTPGNTGNTVKIFEVSLAGATDISGLSSINGQPNLIAAQKTLLLDLTTLGIPIDNLEGLAFGETLTNGNRSLILVSDNNFSPTQFTQFLAFEVESQSVPEPSSILGFGLLGIFGLRRLLAKPLQ
ncbi:esterase-like activity of phytase family protein [Crocosphaera sp. XPORK-15E]|uniref:esterase-like activity of phytase family protein n=1 Tax=Crocosphaera sp. XPORK-15E TaxID=3110247 RepID=UPI002B1FF57F|nr:esterase-like activity of phytase family protein [Crocosphaera sp. XPORK-15E]MEA5534877.1 esterase-like activity of phytase family protein [Crocosphaera sp. XPORK-15E]